MQNIYSITSVPEEYADKGLGDFVCAFSSKNADETHPFFNIFSYSLVFGVLCILFAIIARGYVSADSLLFRAPVGIGSFTLALFGPISILRIYSYYRDKTHYIKSIYIYSDGFIWEAYYKNKLKSLRIFNYDSNVGDVDLTRTDNYIEIFYARSFYKFSVTYYDFEKEEWKKFVLHTDERNRYDNPEKSTWLVSPMRIIYDMWVRHQ